MIGPVERDQTDQKQKQMQMRRREGQGEIKRYIYTITSICFESEMPFANINTSEFGPAG